MMKRIVVALGLAAASVVSFAEEAKTAAPAAPAAENAAAAVNPGYARGPRRADPKDREQFVQMVRKMREDRRQKVIDVIKEFGLDDAKAAELADRLDKIQRERPNFPGRRPAGAAPAARPVDARAVRPDGARPAPPPPAKPVVPAAPAAQPKAE